MNLDYIECDGVRVPADWTVGELRSALEKRKIRFGNEEEIMRVFGEAMMLKAKLQKEIVSLGRQRSSLEAFVKELRKQLICPQCGTIYTEPLPGEVKNQMIGKISI